MDREELQQTDIWTLFQQGQDYARMIDIFNKTDLNFRMFNGIFRLFIWLYVIWSTKSTNEFNSYRELFISFCRSNG